ncbi:MAG TPA: hypothetical protein VHX63_12885 [Acidobacteriaceae bacterium]|nr:hypothetical protein [Acidobacteriaceae bacterium]
MQELWRKTITLFWSEPILWLPVLCADIAAFCLTRLQKFFTRQIVLWFLQNHHSVLSNSPASSNNIAVFIMKAALLAGPFVWGTYFLCICLYTAAFVVTASLVHQFLQRQQSDLSFALTSLRSCFRSISFFSLKLLGLYAIAAVFLVSATSLIQSVHPAKFLTEQPVIFSSFFLISVWIAYNMTPAGIRLLRNPQSPSITAQSIKSGRTFAILIVLASTTIGYFAQVSEMSFSSTSLFSRGIGLLTMEGVASLIVAFPYVLLFIALALTATRNVEDVEPNSAS